MVFSLFLRYSFATVLNLIFFLICRLIYVVFILLSSNYIDQSFVF